LARTPAPPRAHRSVILVSAAEKRRPSPLSGMTITAPLAQVLAAAIVAAAACDPEAPPHEDMVPAVALGRKLQHSKVASSTTSDAKASSPVVVHPLEPGLVAEGVAAAASASAAATAVAAPPPPLQRPQGRVPPKSGAAARVRNPRGARGSGAPVSSLRSALRSQGKQVMAEVFTTTLGPSKPTAPPLGPPPVGAGRSPAAMPPRPYAPTTMAMPTSAGPVRAGLAAGSQPVSTALLTRAHAAHRQTASVGFATSGYPSSALPQHGYPHEKHGRAAYPPPFGPPVFSRTELEESQAYMAAFERGRMFEQGRAFQKQVNELYDYVGHQPASDEYDSQCSSGWPSRDAPVYQAAQSAPPPRPHFDPALPVMMRVRPSLTEEPTLLAAHCWERLSLPSIGF